MADRSYTPWWGRLIIVVVALAQGVAWSEVLPDDAPLVVVVGVAAAGGAAIGYVARRCFGWSLLW